MAYGYGRRRGRSFRRGRAGYRRGRVRSRRRSRMARPMPIGLRM